MNKLQRFLSLAVALWCLTACQQLPKGAASMALQPPSSSLHEFDGVYHNAGQRLSNLPPVKLSSDLWEHLTGRFSDKSLADDLVRISASSGSSLTVSQIRHSVVVASVQVDVSRHRDHLTLSTTRTLKGSSPLLMAVDKVSRHLALDKDGHLIGIESKGSVAIVYAAPLVLGEGMICCRYERAAAP